MDRNTNVCDVWPRQHQLEIEMKITEAEKEEEEEEEKLYMISL